MRKLAFSRTAVIAMALSVVLTSTTLISANAANLQKRSVPSITESKSSGENGGRRMHGLEKLVEDKIITQEQADAITSAIKAGRENGTRTSLESLLTTLVEDGTITQDEADSITEAMAKQQISKAHRCRTDI